MDTESKFSPPYNIAWTTFLTTVERIAADPPGRVDRSYLDSQSGTVQTYLIAALRGFGLIDGEARPTRVLEFADPEKRKEKVADLLREHYPTMVELGTTNATPLQLSEAFAEAFPQITGESRVKATRFLLAGMAYAELPTAPLWGTVKAPRGASGRKTTGRKSTRNGAATTPPTVPPQQVAPPVDDEAEFRRAYFQLLLEKAKDKDDTDLLDRIEKLVGLGSTKAATSGAKTRGGKAVRVQTADSSPPPQGEES